VRTRLTTYPRIRALGGWLLVYWALWAAFIATAALNMLHVRAGFFTNHAADLVVPALLYVMLRGLAERERRPPTFMRRWFGGTPERTGTVLFIASAATEWSQRYWPHGVFSGRYDPLDIAAFGVGIGLCYVCDKLDVRGGGTGVNVFLAVFGTRGVPFGLDPHQKGC
jgi:hypothetical protein